MVIFVNDIKRILLEKLKEEHTFWSYDVSKINVDNITDELLIVKTLRHLDIYDIDLLFHYFDILSLSLDGRVCKEHN